MKTEMKFGTHQFSGAAYIVSGLLHLFTPWISGQGMSMLVMGVIAIGLGYLLYRGTRFLPWVVFLLSAFGVAFAITGAFGAGGWLMWLIVIADLITAASTFWLIWKKP